jgi:hypothetical protein
MIFDSEKLKTAIFIFEANLGDFQKSSYFASKHAELNLSEVKIWNIW